VCIAAPALAQQPAPVPVPMPEPVAAPVTAPAPVAPPVAAPVAPPTAVRTIRRIPVAVPVRPKVKPAPTPVEKPSKAEIGVHLYGLAVGSFMTGVEDDDKVATINGEDVAVVYPGFGGFGGAGGLAVDISYAGIIGVQLGLYGSKDGATGSINNVDFEITQTALHVPVLLRAAIPNDSVRPYIFMGPEFIFPSDPEIDNPNPGGIAVSAEAETYGVFTFGFGFEFMLPVEGMDARIPFSLRGMYNPNVEEGLSGRAEYEAEGDVLTAAQFNSEWEWQAAVSLGIAFYFHPSGGGADPAQPRKVGSGL
jgi:hypothetical protein